MAHLAAQACQSIAISRPLSVSQESQIFSNFNVVFSSSSQYHLNFKVGVMEDGRQNGPIGLLMLADFEQEIKLEYILVTPHRDFNFSSGPPFSSASIEFNETSLSFHIYLFASHNFLYMDTDFSYLRINRPSGIPPSLPEKELYTY